MKLFERTKIGTMQLKNRIVLAPMGTTTDHTYGFNMRDVHYYGERAKGGAGLILTGAVVCSEEFEPAPCQKLTSIKDVYMLHQVVEKVHNYGAKFGIQLSPGIGRMNWIDPNTPPYSASPCPNYYNPNLICRELPTDGVKRLVKAMGVSAKFAMDAGVDIIEIHAYGGYLIDQFNSSRWNHRTDEYGGSLENRMRFMMEIIEEVRRVCGKFYPIAVKMTLSSADDPERPLEEGLHIAKTLADSGLVDLIHYGRGAYSCRWRMVSSVYQPPGFDIEAAKTIREVTGNVPIMAHGKLNHPETAEEALESGAVDLIAIGHGLIADPYWPNKVKKGLIDEINPCIGCGECHFNSMKGWPRPCAVNPVAMHETEYTLEPVKEKKKILVIGGGPGGMKAAATAAQRGYDVTLWEKKERLGGAMAAAGAPEFKKDVRDQVEYLIRQMDKYGVHTVLGKAASLQDVKDFNPDFTVVATGCDPIIIPVPGKDRPIVKTAIPVFLSEEQTGDNVVIIGGGDVGCELACHLSMQGKKVTIVEMLGKIMARGGSFVANEQNLKYLLKNSGAEVVCSARLTEILEDGIKYIKDEEEHVLHCDTVVFAAGFRPDQTLYESIADAGLECIQIGDNVKMGKIIDAIHQGYNSMRVLDL